MGTSDIEAAINSTTQRKEDLRQAFEFLQSHSSSIISFSLKWKDIEDHFSSIEKSITERFRELKELDRSSVVEKPAAAPLALKVEQTRDQPKDVQPRPELKDLCAKMDGEGLLSFVTKNKEDIAAIRNELCPAVLSSPDPVALVLNSIVEFIPSKNTTAAELRSIRMTCINILECLNGSDLEISQQSRDRAMEVAVKWKGLITDGKGVNWTVLLSFLILVTAFGFVESFGVDYILDLIVMAGRKKSIIDLCRSSAFEGKMPDLVDKLTNRGKHLDAVRYVLAFNLVSKYPPASLLKAYIKQSKKIAHEVRAKANNSLQSQNLAIVKEIDALRETIKTVEECQLGSVYPIENHQKRIEQLEKQRKEIKQAKRGPAPANASNSNDGKDPKKLRQRPSSKRPRTLDSSVPALSAQRQAHNPVHPPAHNPLQIGAADRTPYGDFAGSYSWGAAPSLYNPVSSSFPGEYVGLSGSHAPPKSYIHPSESIAGSGYYDRAALNGTYNPSAYSSSYNPSLYH
ncbi:hypothetical protein KSP40_PGU012823 [Platanthera guangdongensis]|uniref:FRIGIDA-like protein n=1 Tax=Platanthera guangdongensis TaxID=2320717 RepID=A0ABR2M501_9ASPA